MLWALFYKASLSISFAFKSDLLGRKELKSANPCLSECLSDCLSCANTWLQYNPEFRSWHSSLWGCRERVKQALSALCVSRCTNKYASTEPSYSPGSLQWTPYESVFTRRILGEWPYKTYEKYKGRVAFSSFHAFSKQNLRGRVPC